MAKKLIKCPNCGYEGEAKTYTKGSLAVEIVLWLFFLLPGLIYSVWRLSSRYEGCPKCGYEHVARQ
jgi:ssDNA-binding Zn-finger/Zn-ribbon topoisomerase 1